MNFDNNLDKRKTSNDNVLSSAKKQLYHSLLFCDKAIIN